MPKKYYGRYIRYRVWNYAKDYGAFDTFELAKSMAKEVLNKEGGRVYIDLVTTVPIVGYAHENGKVREIVFNKEAR